MKKHLLDYHNGEIYIGNVADTAKHLPEAQMVITSPPYFAKRAYLIEDTIIGGDANCQHEMISTPPPRSRSVGDIIEDGKTRKGIDSYDAKTGQKCVKCGAFYGQLGHEASPQDYVNHLADMLTALPLRSDGTMWVNVGDSYCAPPTGRAEADNTHFERKTRTVKKGRELTPERLNAFSELNLQKKSLACIPQRLALAMIERRWIFRQQIIWHKPAPMPSGANDRLQETHEYILLFSRQREYKFNKGSIEVRGAKSTAARYKRQHLSTKYSGIMPGVNAEKIREHDASKRHLRDVWSMNSANHMSLHGNHVAPMPNELAMRCILLGSDEGDVVLDPFGGTGTVAEECYRAGRRFVLCDLDEKCLDFTKERLSGAKIGRKKKPNDKQSVLLLDKDFIEV